MDKIRQMPLPVPKNVKIMTCPGRDCGFDVFDAAYQVLVVSALESRTGKQEIIPQCVFVCRGCGRTLQLSDLNNAN